MWERYISAESIQDCIEALRAYGPSARIVAGATDLMLELERGVRKGVNTLVDITRVPGLDQISLDDRNRIHLGPMVTHNDCVASELIRERAYPLARAAWEVGSPQIRNRGTIAGNIITASPANDTITPLMALKARVTLVSSRGERSIPLEEFYKGVRRTVMEPDEFLVDIAFPALQSHQIGTFIKFALRRAQAISLLNAAIVIGLDQHGSIETAAITLGAVAPTIIHADKAEKFLVGKKLDTETIREAAVLSMQASRPISDLRSSGEYRKAMVKVVVKRGLQAIANGKEREGFPDRPVLLRHGNNPIQNEPKSTGLRIHEEATPIVTWINGQKHIFEQGQHKSLLRLLREEGYLVGSKEGCAEGECGACTVFLDGMAVMACLVPAPRAHGAEIRTVEGLAVDGQLHPVQKAFVEQGAVQCGYCTPGFLMSAVKLLEEYPHPDANQIQQAITGNLCRCTGYYSIIRAIEDAAGYGGSQ
jgi:xanthine dehydrogenase iron-sulfur cluster and FAD-binding subunit A